MNKQNSEYVDAIRNSRMSIYDSPTEEMFIPDSSLEMILAKELIGLSVSGLPIRTRSKVMKEAICKGLGYPSPKTFTKTHPKFPCQNFDVYTQKANNLQIWNEEIDPERRYVIISLTGNSTVDKVRVVSGEIIAKLDRTGTLTQKYQARLTNLKYKAELVSKTDTEPLIIHVCDKPDVKRALNHSPVSSPTPDSLYSISSLFEHLEPLVGKSFKSLGSDQERNRGGELHKLICQALGYGNYQDNGQFPDIKHQLLEVKLQTATTIDLGLVSPDSVKPISNLTLDQKYAVRHCDIRYAIFYGNISGECVILTHFMLVTGEDFFKRFPRFEGNIINKKLQIPLPANFFL